MTRVTLYCKVCGHTARRNLDNVTACRGVHETAAEPALCPRGHGELLRVDGFVQHPRFPESGHG